MEDELVTVAEALEMLVGRPPDPEQHQEAPASQEEEESAFKLFYKGRAGTLKKHNLGKSPEALRELALAEWPKLSADRRLHFLRKVRAAAEPGAAAASERTIAAGESVPAALWGRHKGSEVLLAERLLLPSRALRGACASEAEHGQSSCVPCHGAPTPGLRWGRGRLFERRVSVHAQNSCCCKHLLAAQPDFREEASALQHQVEEPITLSRSMWGRSFPLQEPQPLESWDPLCAQPLAPAAQSPSAFACRCSATSASSCISSTAS
jgi:hypothetical protein